MAAVVFAVVLAVVLVVELVAAVGSAVVFVVVGLHSLIFFYKILYAKPIFKKKNDNIYR